MEPWLGILHLVRQGQGTREEFDAIAAVFCADRQGFEVAVNDAVEARGCKLLWAEDVQPAGQWTARHPKERGAAGLARAVHAGNRITLGPLTIAAPEPVEPTAQAFLHFSEVAGIEPLDDQKGIWPYRTVPDDLAEPLFGQPEPTEIEIARYGASEDVPVLRTFAIVSAEKFLSKSAEVEGCDLPFRCLFKGEAAQERQDEAPYLIELEKDAAFTRRLFSHHPTIPAEMTSVHLWQREPGMYLRSRAELDDLSKHFRRFTRFQDARGDWLFLRFWEGALFPEYWRHFSSSHERVARFFLLREFEQSCDLLFLHAGTLTYIKPDVAALRQGRKPISAFKLNEEDHAFFQVQADARFKTTIQRQLHRRLANAPEEKKDLIAGTVEGSFRYIQARNDHALISETDCFTLALLSLLWGQAAESILNGPLLNEPLLAIGHRIALARETYFEALGHLEKGKA